jgi:hypothetical protein
MWRFANCVSFECIAGKSFFEISKPTREVRNVRVQADPNDVYELANAHRTKIKGI